MTPGISRTFAGEVLHQCDVVVPGVETGGDFPPAHLSLHFRFYGCLHAIDDAMNHPGKKCRIQLITETDDKTGFKLLIFQEFSEEQGGPRGIGPVGTVGPGGESHHVEGILLRAVDAEGEIGIKEDPPPAAIAARPRFRKIFRCLQPPIFDVIARPVGIGHKNLRNHIITETFHVHHLLHPVIMRGFTGTVRKQVIHHGRIMAVVPLIHGHVPFKNVELLLIHPKFRR